MINTHYCKEAFGQWKDNMILPNRIPLYYSKYQPKDLHHHKYGLVFQEAVDNGICRTLLLMNINLCYGRSHLQNKKCKKQEFTYGSHMPVVLFSFASGQYAPNGQASRTTQKKISQFSVKYIISNMPNLSSQII